MWERWGWTDADQLSGESRVIFSLLVCSLEEMKKEIEWCWENMGSKMLCLQPAYQASNFEEVGSLMGGLMEVCSITILSFYMILNAKSHLHNSKHITLLCRFVINLAQARCLAVPDPNLSAVLQQETGNYNLSPPPPDTHCGTEQLCAASIIIPPATLAFINLFLKTHFTIWSFFTLSNPKSEHN